MSWSSQSQAGNAARGKTPQQPKLLQNHGPIFPPALGEQPRTAQGCPALSPLLSGLCPWAGAFIPWSVRPPCLVVLPPAPATRPVTPAPAGALLSPNSPPRIPHGGPELPQRGGDGSQRSPGLLWAGTSLSRGAAAAWLLCPRPTSPGAASTAALGPGPTGEGAGPRPCWGCPNRPRLSPDPAPLTSPRSRSDHAHQTRPRAPPPGGLPFPSCSAQQGGAASAQRSPRVAAAEAAELPPPQAPVPVSVGAAASGQAPPCRPRHRCGPCWTS